jgi:hypothetical protein
MLQNHDIFVWIRIRIRGSMPLTNGSGSWIRILLFSSLTFKMPAKKKFKKQFFSDYYSVADPGYLSRILIFTHPGSRIQIQLQKRGVKNSCHTFFIAKNLTKL